MLNLKVIEPKGQIPEDRYTGIVGVDRAVKLDSIAGQIYGSLDRLGIWAGDSKAEFPVVALREERESEEKNGDMATNAHC